MRSPLPHPRAAVLGSLLLLTSVVSSPATTRHVNILTGVDTNPGTAAAPWKTITKAVQPTSVAAGDLVYIHAGTYAEAVNVLSSGTAAGGFITYQAFPGDKVILDGTTIIPPARSSTGLITLVSQSYLKFLDLELRNLKTTTANHSDVMGVVMTGTSHHIEIRNCLIHDIQTLPPANGIANGIGVYGTQANTPMTAITIDGCEVYNLVTDSSESVTFNGNIDGFQISNCTVHDCNNIGIDCLGFEGIGGTTQDQARNGLILHNTIYNIDSLTNPAYFGGRAAGGIYVDGGKAITIEGNTVHHANIGIELASEHFGYVASDCVVRNNFIYQCHIGGIFLGGSGTTNGGAQNCQLLNNTLYDNDTDDSANGEICFQNYVNTITIKQNVLYAGVDIYGDSYFIRTGGTSMGTVVQRNLYFSTAGVENRNWEWQGVLYPSFASWKTASAQDSLSTFGNPQFTNLSPLNLHILANSPARNAGDPSFAPALGEQEIDAQARVAESVVDLGADEFVPTVTLTSSDLAAAEWGLDLASGTLTRSAGQLTGAALSVALSISGTATNGVDYATLTNITIPAGSISANFTVTPIADLLAEGPETIILAPATVTGAQLNGNAVPLTITIADRPLQQWKFTHFGTNASLAADAADPDGDGRPNLLEYATGTIPTVANAGPLLTITRTNNYATATLNRISKPVDVTLTPQISSNLSTWLLAPNLVLLQDTVTTLQFRDASTMSANPKRWLRVRATAP